MSAATLCWTDIAVTNLDRAITFYSAVLRQEVRKMSEGGLEYGLLPHEEQNASGCLCVGGDSVGDKNQPSQNGPLIYLSVEGRLGEAFQAAKSNGGKVLREKQQIGPPAFRAIVLDSKGNRIALHSCKV
jgi:predicted enzyme related to lactoylglutathione lyase